MTEEKIRLFVAFDVPGPHLRAVERALAALRGALPEARWAPVENLHVTLKFVGWIAAAGRSAAEGCCEAAARATSASEVSLAGLGAFPDPRRARVLWVGIEDPAGTAASLAAALDTGFSALGVPVEERPFTPHLTLARFKRPRSLARELGTPVLPPRTPFPLEEIVLYRSRPTRSGPLYEALRRFPLASGR